MNGDCSIGVVVSLMRHTVLGSFTIMSFVQFDLVVIDRTTCILFFTLAKNEPFSWRYFVLLCAYFMCKCKSRWGALC